MQTFNNLMFGGPRWSLLTVARFLGGGGSQLPDPIDPAKEAAAQIQILEAQSAIAEQQRIAEEQRAGVQRETDLASFNTNVDQSFNTALSTGTSFFERQGVDLDRFLPLLNESLTATRQGIPELSSNPTSFFDALGTSKGILGDELALDRRGFNREIDQFAGSNFANTLIPGTFDDASIDQILSEQFADANASITRARDRGSLTDFGFDSALASLGTQNTAAGSRLQDLGGGILETNRNALRDIGTQARAGANSFQFGDTFDPASFGSRIDSLFGEQQAGIGGSLRNALGGESLFNISDILARASSAQGSQNTSATSPNLLAAIAKRDEDRTQARGIGTQGAF